MRVIILLLAFYGFVFGGCGCVDAGNAIPIAGKATDNYKSLDNQLLDEIKELNVLFDKAKKLTETQDFLLNESTKYQQVSFDKLNFTLSARKTISSIYAINNMAKKDVIIKRTVLATTNKAIYRYKKEKNMPVLLPKKRSEYIKAKKPVYQIPKKYSASIVSRLVKTEQEEIEEETKEITHENEIIDPLLPIDKPLDEIYITSPYGFRIHPTLRIRKFHKGVDLRARTPKKVYATANGVVERAKYNRGGYGYYIMLKHPTGYKSLYAHLDRMFVKVGQRIKRGDIIGLSGNTGRSSAPHLHYEIRYKGKPVNPKIVQ